MYKNENKNKNCFFFRKIKTISLYFSNIYNDDRRFRHYCPLTNFTFVLNEHIHDPTLLNVPCNKTNEKYFKKKKIICHMCVTSLLSNTVI